MTFGLEKSSVVLDGNNFQAHKITETEQHLFSARVEVVGRLNYGRIPQGTEAKLSLAANGITTPVRIDEIVALTPTGVTDELEMSVYRTINGRDVLIGSQRYFNKDGIRRNPDGVIDPDMVLGIKPLESSAIVVVYARPVQVLFDAVLNPPPLPSDDSEDSNGSNEGST